MSLDSELWELARLIACDWYRQAIRDPYATFYLYWRHAKPGERIALPIASREHDAPEGFTQGMELNGEWSVDAATTHIRDALRTLPILG